VYLNLSVVVPTFIDLILSYTVALIVTGRKGNFFCYGNINNTQTASKDVNKVHVHNKYIDGCVINQSLAGA